jgi:DNA-binding IclR family transcriptional regulator
MPTTARKSAVKTTAKAASKVSAKGASRPSPQPARSVAVVESSEPAEKGQRRIQSLEVGFSLVRAIEAAPAGLSLKDVSAAAGMPRSKAHLYLATFLAIGLLARDAAGHYRLGPFALQMGLSALRQSSVVDLSDEAMRRLQTDTGHSVHLSVWGNHGPTIVRKIDSHLKVPMGIQVGYVLPLLSSASGRVFLAWQPWEQTQPILQREQPGAHMADKPTAALVAEVRAQGLATSSGRVYEGFAALSAPVRDHRGELCAALTLLDSAALMDIEVNSRSATLLRQAAKDISTRLGSAG